MNKNNNEVKEMKKTMAILLAAILMIMAGAVSVYADDDEGNEANEANENQAGEGNSDDDDDEKENSVPGFEFIFAAGAAIAAARFIRARQA